MDNTSFCAMQPRSRRRRRGVFRGVVVPWIRFVVHVLLWIIGLTFYAMMLLEPYCS